MEMNNLFDEDDYKKILNHFLFGKTEFSMSVRYSSALTGFLQDKTAKYLVNKIIKNKPELIEKEMISNVLSAFSFMLTDKADKQEELCIEYIGEFLNLVKESESFDRFLKEEINKENGNQLQPSMIWILGTKIKSNKILMNDENYVEFKNYLIKEYQEDFIGNKIFQAKIYRHSAKGFWSDTDIINEVIEKLKFNSLNNMLRMLRIDFLTDKEFECVVENNLIELNNLVQSEDNENGFTSIVRQGILRVKDNEFDDKFLIIVRKLNEKENIEKANEYFNLYIDNFHVLLGEKYLKNENSKSEKKEEFVLKKLDFIKILIDEQHKIFTEKELDSLNKMVKDLNSIATKKNNILSDKLKKSIDHFIMSYELTYLNVNMEKSARKRNKI